MLDRCSVADGGKMLLKFLEPGFLKRWRAEPEKSRVSACSLCPTPPRGSCTSGCLDSVTRIVLPWRRWPFRWLIAVTKKTKAGSDHNYQEIWQNKCRPIYFKKGKKILFSFSHRGKLICISLIKLKVLHSWYITIRRITFIINTSHN